MSSLPVIAVVDDDPSVCKALRRLLRTSGMDVEAYDSGDEFLLSLHDRKPDCLVLDIRMPGMTGPELQQRLVDMKQPIPIVFITAHAEDIVPDRSQQIAGMDVLHKPFDDEALLTAIQRAMRGCKSE
ncbi:MAG: response regulator [Candidatus Latescibacterota bacterium]|nr:MAG: response regulator [Candidatus Latescibacterota bacterium]